MNTSDLVGLWEFAGFWDEARAAPVMPSYGSQNAALREFLLFGDDGTFVFAKFPRDETLSYDPDQKRLDSETVHGALLRGDWRLEGNRLIESVHECTGPAPRKQDFELETPSADRLIVYEPTKRPATLLKVVYDRCDVEQFPAPPLPDEGVAADRARGTEADAQASLQAEQDQIASLLAAGKCNTAHRLAQRSVRYSERVFGAEHPHTAACLCTLGACLVKAGDSDAAVSELERAKRIYDTRFGQRALATASALNNLSPAYRAANNFRAAVAAAVDAVRIRSAALGSEHPSTAISIQNLGLALSGLGFVSEAMHCYFRAAAIHESSAGPADARAQAVRANIETLAESVRRDPRFACDALPDPGTADEEAAAFDAILDACDRILAAEAASDLFTLAYGRAAHTESYVHLMFGIRLQQRTIADTPTPDQPLRIERLREAQRRLRADVSAPMSTFRGALKRIDRSTLGPKSLVTLRHVFPNFSGDIHEAEQREIALREFGIDPHALPTFTDRQRRHAEALGFQVQSVGQQFRRYSGERNLPSQRYSTVCVDATGNDEQTLCRELFEYIDVNIPGFFFAGDTGDVPLMRALIRIGLPMPLVHGIFVFMVPPPEDADMPAYRHFLGPVLSTLHGSYEGAKAKWDGMSIVFIPTTVTEVEIEDVVDLRQPAAQDWLFRFFREGDGAVCVKFAATPISGFAQMLPSLVYPEYGGSGVTKSIGSWMRSAGVRGLVFPSARSDASIEVDDLGGLRRFHGWNFVDYRDTELVPDRLVHADHNDWYDLVAGRQGAPVLRQDGRSWALQGAEARYQQARAFMLDLPRTGIRFGA